MDLIYVTIWQHLGRFTPLKLNLAVSSSPASFDIFNDPVSNEAAKLQT